MFHALKTLSLVGLAWLSLSCSGPEEAGELPRPEHPRPDFQREQWLNLNGRWDFRFDPADEGVDQEWFNSGSGFDHRIQVPFCWESALSGIQDTEGHQIGWYRRQIEIPGGWEGRRVWLRFEAVDWEARVWVNGAEVGRHEGGYTPFAFDISEHTQPGETAAIVVRAYDPTDRQLPTGKQVARWYTFTSGIWQTVWLEARPATYISGFSLVPRRRDETWSVEVSVDVNGSDGQVAVRVSSPDEMVTPLEGPVQLQGGRGHYSAQLAVSSPRLWTPDDPSLYNLKLELAAGDGQNDVVETYFGLRTIERGRHGNHPYESILLNGEPIYLRGALDQSFNPQGIHTAPSDEFLRRDMELAKSLGLNFLRIHIKPDEPRRLYWADKMGVLLMQDMPNTWAQSPGARQAWESTMREVIERDRNHPAIIAWCLFNETWGLGSGRDYGDAYRNDPDTQQWVLRMWEEVKQRLDPSRLVEDNSPDKRDHLKTDLNSWHFYIDDYDRAREHVEEVVSNTKAGSTFNFLPGYEQNTAPLINSEYGAVSAGGGDRDISWGFRYLTTLLRKHGKIQGYIYTELSDIEFEHNGFVNYDRFPKEFGYDAFVPGMTVSDLQGADFVGFDASPVIEVEPGSVITLPVFVSHFSDRTEPPVLHAWLRAVNELGGDIELHSSPKPVRWERYGVVAQTPLRMNVPDLRNFAGAIGIELLDAQEKRIAANFVNIVARPRRQTAGEPSPRFEVLAGRRAALRVAPDAFSAVRWRGGGPNFLFRRGKFYAYGAGSVEYRFEIPESVLQATPARLEFLAELATKADREKIAWPTFTPLDYPQTDERKHPGIVHLSMGGELLEPIELPDDPADARGFLSHKAGFHHGSYGYLVRRELDLSSYPALVERLRQTRTLRVVLSVADGPGAAGLSIHGENTGRFPIDPTLLIETEQSITSLAPSAE